MAPWLQAKCVCRGATVEKLEVGDRLLLLSVLIEVPHSFFFVLLKKAAEDSNFLRRSVDIFSNTVRLSTDDSRLYSFSFFFFTHEIENRFHAMI